MIERYGSSGETRVGVVCQKCTKPLPRIHADDFWDKQLPVSKPSDSMGHSHRYVGTVAVGSCRYFEACVEDLGSDKICFGMRFYGSDKDIILGEWRLDKVAQRRELPTATVLVNKRRNGRSCVVLGNAEDDVDFVRIEGVLEWWTSFRGSEVISCPI